MHGVMLSFLPPGHAPATPVEMIQNLRRPMRKWAELPWDDLPDDLGTFAILEKRSDHLTDEAVEYGSDYAEALFEHHGDEADKIPQWAYQAFEKVERAVYGVLVSAGQAEYVATRRLLIEVPAGPYETVASELHQRGALHTGAHVPIPPDQLFTWQMRAWYVPCPECRWPMHVRGGTLACRYAQHPGLFRVRESTSGAPVIEGPALVAAHEAEDAVCVHEAIWRHITVPGVTEVKLMDWLVARSGIGEQGIQRWPHKDRWDITVQAGNTEFEVDLKDARHPSKIAAKPPRVRYIVVPDYRRNQIPQLRRSLPPDRFTPCTVHQFKARVRKALNEGVQWAEH